MSTVVFVLVPRFELLTALGAAPSELPPFAPKQKAEVLGAVALAPQPDREQVIGAVSGAAEAFGLRRGMRLGEALSRCPELRLVAADPERAAAEWDAALGALEALGADVESYRPGEACFEADGLRRLYGGNVEGVLARVRRALPLPARLGVGSSRFCAFAAAGRARPGRAAKVVPAGAARAYLAPLPVSLLRTRVVARSGTRGFDLPAALERLGVRTLGELAALDPQEMADRFGHPGLRALELALGRDTPLAPRPLREQVSERIELPEAVSGLQLEQMLVLLIDRLLTRRERRGRALRKLRLGARFVEQGAWRREVALRQATVCRDRLRLALGPKLAELPAPIEQLSLAVVVFGPPISDQLSFTEPDGSERRRRLVEALRQTRAAAGDDSLLRVLELDPTSRVPERRALLTPFPE